MNGNHIRKDINRKPLTFTMVIVLLCSMIAIFGLSMDVVSAIPVSESLGTNAQGEEQVDRVCCGADRAGRDRGIEFPNRK